MNKLPQWTLLLLSLAFQSRELALSEATGVSQPRPTTGREFLVFPGSVFQNIRDKEEFISMQTTGALMATVSLSTPRKHTDGVHIVIHLLRGKVETRKIPGSLRMNSSGLHNTAIYVQANEEIILTNHYILSDLQRAQLHWRPLFWAGTLYILILEKMIGFAIAATEHDTEVKAYECHGQGGTDPNNQSSIISIAKNNNVQSTSQPFGLHSISLSRFQILFSGLDWMKCEHLVTSSPVLIIAWYEIPIEGRVYNNSNGLGRTRYKENLPPVEQWSNDYVCLGIQGNVTVMTSSPSVSVTVVHCGAASHSFFLPTVGSFKEFTVSSSCPVRVKASQPVHVSHFICCKVEFSDGFLFNVVPVEKFLPSYTFALAPLDDKGLPRKHTLYIVIKSPKIKRLLFIGHKVLKPRLISTSNGDEFSVYAYQTNTNGRLTVLHQDGVRFGLYVLGTSYEGVTYWVTAASGYTQMNSFCVKGFPHLRFGDTIDSNCTDQNDTTALVVPGRVLGVWGEWQAWHCSTRCDLTEIRYRLRFCDISTREERGGEGGNSCEGKGHQLDDYCTGENALCALKCPYGTWAANCSKKCPEHCALATCDVQTGMCTGFNCTPGYRGEYCNIPCARNEYGYGCLRMCSSRCGSSGCHYITGQCDHGILNFQIFLIAMPFIIVVPTVLIMCTVKFCRLPTLLELLRVLQWRTSVLAREERLLRRKSGKDRTPKRSQDRQRNTEPEVFFNESPVNESGGEEGEIQNSDTTGTTTTLSFGWVSSTISQSALAKISQTAISFIGRVISWPGTDASTQATARKTSTNDNNNNNNNNNTINRSRLECHE